MAYALGEWLACTCTRPLATALQHDAVSTEGQSRPLFVEVGSWQLPG
jgi:hypothetical protein